MKIIRDAIHDNIELNSGEIAVIDTPEMQRLRFVRQLSLAYLVYPSAHHTRFEHSLGTFHLTKVLSGRLFPEDKGLQQLLRLSALLHDVGHSAFSHLPEGIVYEHLRKRHEDIGEDRIKSGNIARALEKSGISPKELLKIHRSPKVKLISSELGTDRMDYLLRDAYFTGVGYSLVDAQRLLFSLSYEGGNLLLMEKGLLAAESLLVSRYLMFNAVYNHHAVRIAGAMLEKALRIALSKKSIGIADITEGTDEVTLYKLRREPLIARILGRNLYKAAFEAPRFFYKGNEESERKKIEVELSRELGDADFVVSLPKQTMGAIDMEVAREDGKTYPLASDSPILEAVSKERKASGLIVATDMRDMEKAAKICRKIF
ncbi:MAG TPA: HD domain-containing protein [Candidatus Norongarragalinales archaeon]|nr:HD domain-containing protein [Candidatus Norongarragalinales archaeon]